MKEDKFCILILFLRKGGVGSRVNSHPGLMVKNSVKFCPANPVRWLSYGGWRGGSRFQRALPGGISNRARGFLIRSSD